VAPVPDDLSVPVLEQDLQGLEVEFEVHLVPVRMARIHLEATVVHLDVVDVSVPLRGEHLGDTARLLGGGGSIIGRLSQCRGGGSWRSSAARAWTCRLRGAGLGLGIVSDVAATYLGSLQLDRSELGGLMAVVTLPRSC